MNVKIAPRWKDLIGAEFEKPYFEQLAAFVKQEYATRQVFPAGKNIFRAFDKCDPDDLKVVIIGQDPYHGVGQANGLCFSVNDGVQFPPSLVNIFKELQDDVGFQPPESGNLTRWAQNGVLLLNAVLTVRAGMAGSHAGMGWETLTDKIIALLGEREKPIVFLLWGGYARRKAALIPKGRHLILEAAHPSPLSAHNGFFGCRHFSKANAFLDEPIDWQL